jgi:acetyl esterase/lipase
VRTWIAILGFAAGAQIAAAFCLLAAGRPWPAICFLCAAGVTLTISIKLEAEL